MKNLPSYHETLWQAVSAVQEHLVAREIVTDVDWSEAFNFGGIPYGGYRDAHFPIVSIKGKPSRKHGHINIWRLDSGRYEVNFYLL